MTPENFDIDQFESAFKAGAKASTAPPPPDLFDQIIKKSTINSPAAPVAGASNATTSTQVASAGSISATFYWVAASILIVGGIATAILLNSDNKEQSKNLPTVVDPINGKPSPDSNHQPADSTSHQHQDENYEDEMNETSNIESETISTEQHQTKSVFDDDKDALVNHIEDEEAAPIKLPPVDKPNLTSDTLGRDESFVESPIDQETSNETIGQNTESKINQENSNLEEPKEEEEEVDPFKSFIKQNDSDEDQIQLFDKKKQSGN